MTGPGGGPRSCCPESPRRAAIRMTRGGFPLRCPASMPDACRRCRHVGLPSPRARGGLLSAPAAAGNVPLDLTHSGSGSSPRHLRPGLCLVMAEEYLKLRKSKPVLVAARHHLDSHRPGLYGAGAKRAGSGRVSPQPRTGMPGLMRLACWWP